MNRRTVISAEILYSFSSKVYKLSIKSQWNGKAIDHNPVALSLSSGPHGNSVKVDVQAPFFNDPGCPPSPAKEPCDELWEYEGLLSICFFKLT